MDYKTKRSEGHLEAKLQITEHSLTKCAKQRDEYKHQLNAANKEIEILKQKLKDVQSNNHRF